MPIFTVRVCLNPSFALTSAENNLYALSSISRSLPAELLSEFYFERFTFGLFKATASSENVCRKAFDDTFKKLYPDYPDGAEFLVMPRDEDDDHIKLMDAVYKLYGAESYLKLTTELFSEIPLLKSANALPALRMQNYLFAIDPGCGFTTLLSSFGDYLRRMGVFEEESERKTMHNEYVLSNETDGPLISLNDAIERLSGDDEDCSVIGLDISYFLEGNKFDELRSFVRRLHRFQDKYIFVFKVPFLEKSALAAVADALSDLLLLRVVEIPPLHDSYLWELYWDKLSGFGFKVSYSVREPFLRRVLQEKKDGRFYGFKTVEKLANEAALQKASHDASEKAAGNTPDTESVFPTDLTVKESKKEKSGYDALSELIGMEEIEKRVREITAQVKLSMTDERLDRPCIHMRFVGAPGTGKTTVARIIGQIFREEGILRKGAFLEYSARTLCAEYVGQTAVKTSAICRDAYGSVLFIDEAYALYNDDMSANDYGKEALTTLIAEMENHRDDMLVIMAGYTDEMDTLMKGNTGLRSRMPYLLDFKSYTRDQLFQIFMLMVRKHFDFEPGLETEARRFFTSLSDNYINSREFANARFVRNLYERTWSKGALRAALAGVPKIALTREDFIAASGEKEFSERLERRKTVGF